ncbi:MAG: glycosyltransferase family 4 protein [Sphingobacteriales bacterium]|nr:glycosyltransferase family 4 protein [Sphingobacteriales bacterium]
MKILFVQKMAAISGSELYLMHLLPELKKRGYEVKVLIIFPVVPPGTQPFIGHFRERGIETFEIYGHSALSPALCLKLRRLLKKEKFDLVQSNLVHADLWLALQKMLFFPKMRLISVKHGFDEAYSARYGNNPAHLKKSMFYWVQKFSGFFADYNVTISKGLYNMYVQGGIVKKERIRNIYYGLDLSEKEKKVTERVPEETYALILGRLVQYKGHSMLLEAWKKVKAENPSWKLYIVGGGNYEAELKKQYQESGLGDSVRFLGYQANPHQLIKDARFMLVTSTFEGFGLIMLEGWVHKKPAIGFDVPAINEAVADGETGRLIPPFDTDKLAAAIVEYFRNPDKTRVQGEAGYRRLHDYFTVARMTDEMETVYSAVAAKHN